MFENRFYTTKEMYKEYVNKVLCRTIYIWCIVLILIALLAIIAAISNNHKDIVFQESIGVFIVLCCIIFIPRITLRQLLQLDKTLHNGTHPECHVTFFDKITMVEGEQKITVEYENVRKIYRLKSCSVLMIGKQNGVLYVEDCFTVGNAEDFEKFILEKCTQVKKIESR